MAKRLQQEFDAKKDLMLERQIAQLNSTYEKQMEGFSDIMADPRKRTDFTNSLVGDGKSLREPDRAARGEFLTGTFLAEQTQATAREVKESFRRAENTLAIAKRRKLRSRHM